MVGDSVHRLHSLKLLALVATILFGFALAQAFEKKEQHFSTRDGTTIRLQPSEASFEIPSDWDGWYFEQAELTKVKRGRGEWYAEYAKVANAALPFTDCSAQAGRYLWNSPTFAGVTVRAYVTNRNAPKVEVEIATKAFSAAKALPSPTIRNASLTNVESEQWHRTLIAYDVWYGDYGGRANVDFYATEKNGNTIVLVFMYADMDHNLATVQQILKSFSW
jgi:hypothetical protein